MKRASLALLLFALVLGGTPSVATASDLSQAVRPLAKPLPHGRVEINLENLHCASCANQVARALYAQKGVLRVQASLEKNLVVVHLQSNAPVRPTALWVASSAADMKPTEIRYGAWRIEAEQMAGLLRTAQRPTVAR